MYDKSLEDGTTHKVLKEMERVPRDKVIIIHGNKCSLLFFKQNTSAYHYFTEKELKKMLESIGLHNVKIMYVTHSVPLLFNLLGEIKTKKIEKVIQNTPIIKTFGGGVIACGKKT